MSKTSKKQITQVSTSRRQLLKKLSYSPPLLMCLGSLTKPSVVKATHPTDDAATLYWLNNIEEGIAYDMTRNSLSPAPQTTPEYMEWFQAGHPTPEQLAQLLGSNPPNVAQTP